MVKNKKILLSPPSIFGNEWKYVKDCLDTEWISTAGKYINKFEEKIKVITGAKYAIACINATSALQISVLLSGAKNGDEIIVPTTTFIAPINAVIYNNCSPIFMDTDEFHNIDEEKTIQFIKEETEYKKGHTYNKRTKKIIRSIIVVHVWGNAARIKSLLKICKERNIKVIEDASEGLGTFYKSNYLNAKHVGTLGFVGCISFNANKIITSGGGGVILTNNKALADKAYYLISQAKNNQIYYIHNEVGYNLKLTNLHAALGLAQLENLELFLRKRSEIKDSYKSKLEKFKNFKILDNPNYSKNNNWLTILKFNTSVISIRRLTKLMIKRNIQVRPIWKLNHLQKPFKHFQAYKIKNAYKNYRSCLCLPSGHHLKEDEIKKIIKVLKYVSK